MLLPKQRDATHNEILLNNLSIDEELLSDCKELGINLSLVLEERLKEIRRAAIKAQIAAYVKYENEQIDEYGIWSEGARAW